MGTRGRLQGVPPAGRHTAKAIVALATVTALVAGPHQDQPTYRAAARLVVVQVTVTDGHGDLVSDLDQDAFTVREDGTAQSIAVFRRDDVPVSVGILIDNSGSMRDKRRTVEAAALAFVGASNPQDEVFVMNFADEPRLDVPFTMSLAHIKAGIARLDSLGGTAMRDAIDAATTYLSAHATRDRRALLLVTDGRDNASVTTTAALQAHVEQSGAVIFAVGLLAGESPAQAARARRDLDDSTNPSGGRAFFPNRLEEIDAIVLQIAQQLRRQYTIAYTPRNQALDGSYRKIQVVARGAPHLKVRTRAGYVARPDGTTARPPAVAKAPGFDSRGIGPR